VAWGVETVQFQEFLYTELIKRAARAGIAFPGVAMPEPVEKELRIVSLQPHVANGKIRLVRGQSVLLEQLKFWPEADHDDGPDAQEKLWRLACQFGGEWDYTPRAPCAGQTGAFCLQVQKWTDGTTTRTMRASSATGRPRRQAGRCSVTTVRSSWATKAG
jgi:hypothetical protein